MILVPHYLLQHRLDPRVFIYEFHHLPEVIPEVNNSIAAGVTPDQALTKKFASIFVSDKCLTL